MKRGLLRALDARVALALEGLSDALLEWLGDSPANFTKVGYRYLNQCTWLKASNASRVRDLRQIARKRSRASRSSLLGIPRCLKRHNCAARAAIAFGSATGRIYRQIRCATERGADIGITISEHSQPLFKEVRGGEPVDGHHHITTHSVKARAP